MATQPTSDILKDRRVWLAGAIGLLLLAGGGFFAYNQFAGGGAGGGDETGATPPAPVAANPAAPGAAPAGNPAAPGGAAPAPAGAPAAPGAAAAGAAKPAAQATPQVAHDSWWAAPESFPGGGGAGQGAAAGAVPPPGGMPGAPEGAGAAGAPAGGAGGAALPAPIKPGVQVASYRVDPFVTTRRFVVDKPFAYTFLAPFRLASRPQPVLENEANKYLSAEELRPLPPVARRVAGVLFDGSTSAIVETGQPGPDADVRVVQPGSRVPSGIADMGDLTVSVITPTDVTLRADDGRTVTVPLSNLPAAIAEQLRQQAGQQAGGGFGGPEGPGAPGGVPGAPGRVGPRGFGGPPGAGGPAMQ